MLPTKHAWGHVTRLDVFQDGPKQFKSAENLTIMSNDIMLAHAIQCLGLQGGRPQALGRSLGQVHWAAQGGLELGVLVDQIRRGGVLRLHLGAIYMGSILCS